MQINNSTSPNFKAMVFTPNAKTNLNKFDIATLQKLSEVKTFLNGTRTQEEIAKNPDFFNLVVDPVVGKYDYQNKIKLALEVSKERVKDYFFDVFKPHGNFFNNITKSDSTDEIRLQFYFDKGNGDDLRKSVKVSKQRETEDFKMMSWQTIYQDPDGLDKEGLRYLTLEQIDVAANVVKELNTQSEIVYKEKQEAMKKLQAEKDNMIDNLLS